MLVMHMSVFTPEAVVAQNWANSSFLCIFMLYLGLQGPSDTGQAFATTLKMLHLTSYHGKGGKPGLRGPSNRDEHT